MFADQLAAGGSDAAREGHAWRIGLELTPVFAMGRVVGWTAHCLEQAAEGRLLRPRADYIGEMDCTWRELAERI